MNAELIYKTTLQKLAEAGNPEAKMALVLGAAAEPSVNVREAIVGMAEHLRQANTALGDALRHNEYEWTRDTDRSIERARSEITKALIVFATK